MANGKRVGWTPANDDEEVKAEAGQPYLGIDGNYYQHQDFAEASRKNPPAPAPVPSAPDSQKSAAAPSSGQAAPSASGTLPSAADLDSVAAEQKAANATAEKTKVALQEEPSAPPSKNPDLGYDADKFDSTGKGKKDGSPVGPRGVNKPFDAMTEAERNEAVAKSETKLRQGASATHSIDSRGNPKGNFAVTPQGNDPKTGAKIPDKVDYETPTEPFVPVHGPRGKGAPKDTFSR